MTDPTPSRIYGDLASWWPLLSPPSHYVEEAADLLPSLLSAAVLPATSVLELGCGGGSLAWHFKQHMQLTLSDISPQMLAISQSVNPECDHVLGDMRTLDLGRLFDRVFVHDAIMYMTDEASVRAVLATARRHCRRGGAAMIVPDHVKETFEPDSSSGGEDHPDGRGLRYLEWSWDPDPADETFEVAYAFLLRASDGTTSVDTDRHQCGLFPRASWMDWIRQAGFEPRTRLDAWNRDVFTGCSAW